MQSSWRTHPFTVPTSVATFVNHVSRYTFGLDPESSAAHALLYFAHVHARRLAQEGAARA